MGGIDFLSENKPNNDRGKKPKPAADIEYTSGAELTAEPPSHPGFFSWRKKRQENSLSTLTNKPQQQKVPTPVFATSPQRVSSVLPQKTPKRATQRMPLLKNAMESSAFSEGASAAPRSDRAQVNLLPRDFSRAAKPARRLRDLFLVALLGIAFIALVDIGLVLYQRQIHADTASVEKEIQDFEKEIATYAMLATKAQNLNTRLEALRDSVGNHIYWTPLLQLLEERTLANVYYERMSGTATTGAFTFQTIAPNFQTIETQVNALRTAPFVESVSVQTAATTTSTKQVQQQAPASSETTAAATSPTTAVSFRMDVQFQPSLFKKMLP